MPLLYDIPDETKRLWDSIRESLRGPIESVDKATKWPFPDSVAGPGLLSGFDAMYPKDTKDAFVGGILGLAPGYIAANYRSPEQIQVLRKMMAEEMRSRGGINRIIDDIRHSYASTLNPTADEVAEFGLGQKWGHWNESLSEMRSNYGNVVTPRRLYEGKIDPIDQILRGSWYHGMSRAARDNFKDAAMDPKTWRNLVESGELGSLYPSKVALPFATEHGFPASLHDAQSISNKLGEPAGVSISMLPTKAQQFSADEYIHRVLPQYGGPPTERVVNLMSPEGRTALNDAYDAVANQYLTKSDPVYGFADPLKATADVMQSTRDWNVTDLLNQLPERMQTRDFTGPFNRQLSNQLQSSGYRGLLYNPQRWNEYEMLMLDPKYVLPLDYRSVGEYIPGYGTQVGAKNYKNFYDIDYGATPGIRKGLNQIQDLMSQNASRLGDIYSERPWTQRLSDENKQRLLELIDPQYRETVGNQLYQP